MMLGRLSRPFSRSILSRSVVAASLPAPSCAAPRRSGPPPGPATSPELSSVIDALRRSGGPLLLEASTTADTGFIDARRSCGLLLPRASAPAYTSTVDARRRSGPSPLQPGLISGAAVGHCMGPLSWSTATRGFSSSSAQGPSNDSTEHSTVDPRQLSVDRPSEDSSSSPCPTEKSERTTEDSPELSSVDSTDESKHATEDSPKLSAAQMRFLKRNLKHLLRPAWRPPTHEPLLDRLQPLKRIQYAKMVEGVTFEECVDGSALFLNFDPLVYAKTVPVMYADLIPGSSSKDLFWAVTDAAKVLIRSLFTLLVSYHKMGWCFRILNLGSVVITGEGKFKLRASRIDLVPLTPEGVDADYESALAMVKMLLTASCGQEIFAKMTPDFINLFKIMKEGSKYEYLIYTNVALLPLSSWETVYLKLYTEIEKVLKKDDILGRIYKLVLSEIRMVGWAAIVQSNSIVKRFCPVRHPEDMLYNQGYVDNFQNLLDLIRNAIAHKKDINPYPDVVFSFVLYALFTTLLSSLQNALFGHGVHRLGRLRIEDNFNDGKLHLTDFLPKFDGDNVPPTQGTLTLADKIAMLHAEAASSKEDISGFELFVGGLAYDMTDQDLRDSFAPYGSVIEASICLETETGRSKGFGYVTYTTIKEALAAIAAMHGTVLKGRKIRVAHFVDQLFGGDTSPSVGGRGSNS